MFQMLPDMPMAAKFFAAFVIVLALIGLTAWLVRRFGANRLSSSARGRQPRLAVIDAASVDGRRRLVLIRRDNVEHLMMIGGPNDVIIEPNIVRAGSAREAGRDTVRATGADSMPRAVSLSENGGGNWPLQPVVEPPAPPPMQPPPRAYRAPVSEEPWVAPEPAPREAAREPSLRARPADSISGMASDFSARLNAELELPPPPRMAPVAPPPMREAAPTPPPSAAPQTDRNLAEMAQRLEAALRRPNASEFNPPVTDALAATTSAPPIKAVDPEPKVEFKPEPAFEPAPEPTFEPKHEAKPEFKSEFKPEPSLESKPKPAKNAFDSLEEEMASLLGRSGKT
jgi:hypothetical protein